MNTDKTSNLADEMLDPNVYAHPVARLQRLETHMSWLFLTGDYVYKLKKPVHFDFVDFSTLALHEHYCHEELRLNKSLAPELYLGVVPITSSKNGSYQVDPEPIHPPYGDRRLCLREG